MEYDTGISPLTNIYHLSLVTVRVVVMAMCGEQQLHDGQFMIQQTSENTGRFVSLSKSQGHLPPLEMQ